MSEDTKKNKANWSRGDEDELSELLDSALADFGKPSSTKAKTLTTAGNEKEQCVDLSKDVQWTDEFVKQAATQFESNLAKLFEANGSELTPENLQQSFQKMAEAATQVASDPGQLSNTNSVSNTITQTLQNLSAGMDNVGNPFSEQDLMKMFAVGQNGDENAFLPFMRDMMQSLLSKDVLYPSLKDLLEKYPEWLSSNGSSLSQEQLEKYEKQQEIMKQVCSELELEKESDTDEQKKARFEKVLTLMQKLQDYGQPPKDLIGDVPLDLPQLTDQPGAEQCAQM